MHPTATRHNRSSIQSAVPPTSTPSPIVHPQQQQQQILYGPIPNPTLTLQPCGTSLHPSCIYPGARRNAALTNPVPLHIQGKSSRWPPKNKLVRNPEYCQQQQQHIQQQLSYNPKSLVLFDQTTNTAPVPAPTASFLIASSTYTHGSFSGDQYNSGITLVPQAYFKSPDVQTFCLLQDRQQQQQQEQLSHGSYYNVSSTNTCNLQTINTNPLYQFHNPNPYASPANYSNQITSPVQTSQSNQIFPNPPVNLVFGNLQRDKSATTSATFDIATFKCAKNRLPAVNDSQIPSIAVESYSEWPSQATTSSANNLLDIKPSANDAKPETTAYPLEKAVPNVPTKTQEEHYSDESSASFDFTIEAEKMVSALCNTSSNDIGKDETKNDKSDSAPLFNGAGDTISNKNTWFTDFCVDYGTSTSKAVQTDGANIDRAQYPELLRKVIYWGCTEAEVVLNNNCKTNQKFSWLRNLSTATKTAVTKSSTCFPIFAGDRVFVSDLINALLRISNGWLILDNYLNKQHYPSLDDKLNCELIRCFQQWEENTHELLNQIVQTFMKLEENGDTSTIEQKPESFGTSFPGDVSVYTNHDLFDPSSGMKQESANKRNDQDPPFNVAQLPRSGSLRNFGQYNVNQPRQSSEKETKLRSKWTITDNENVTTIDSTKSVGDMFPGHVESGAQSNGRFRSRGNPSSAKTDTSTQSLNAEFFHLRSKVLTESNQEPSRQWTFKEKKEELAENGSSPRENVDSIFRLQQRQLDENYESSYAQKCLSKMESSFLNPSISLQSMYFTSNNEAEHFYPNYPISPSYTVDYGHKHLKNIDQNHGSKGNMDLIYVGKSSTSQLQLAAVPKDKMTLLSQIEPSVPEKSSEEMTANLSAWFASIRNSDNRQMSFMNLADGNMENVTSRTAGRHETSKDLGNCIRQLQIDANCQFQTLQNMQSIQTAPWNAYNLINNRIQVQQVPEEYDSSEDVRVYMKPGSYNVPKKRHQRRSNRRLDNSRNTVGESSANHRNHYSNKEKTYCAATSSTPLPRPIASVTTTNSTGTITKLPFPASPIVPSSAFSLDNSPRILKRSDTTNYTVSEDVTWKAACASAEILLEALNVKKDTDSKKKESQLTDVSEEPERIKENDNSDTTRNQEKLKETFAKTVKDDKDVCGGVSSYEASEDESESTYRLSPNTSINEISQSSENKNGSSKMNVKTDSWLIRTLNNVSMANKQKRRKNTTKRHSSESSNSSVTENEQTAAVSSMTNGDVNAITMIKNVEETTCLKQSSVTSDRMKTSEKSDRITGKATYSETVRRCTSLSASFTEKKEFSKKGKLNIANASAISARKCQRKDLEKSYRLLHNKLCKFPGKKTTRNYNIDDPQETSKSVIGMKHSRKKENAEYIEFLDGKSDRGWSVWYSSKRKQSLSPLALSKLEMIHQAVWQMEEAEIFKCPSSRNNDLSSAHTIEDYCKVIKSPMFLETVEYKLKNRIYHKVEHAVRDFRRIVYNSRLYHKNDHDRVKTIETLSKKLEELFEEHFASWDFDDISGSPRESSPVFHRFKTTEQKSVTRRYSNAKKSPSPSITESI
ncbi:uncharacterized protein LOC114879887 [Osmia bicornis bicornis]|uniref:uncharacterized protein LOC114879887 n=1 Tax=Osmia bicornis bicornis TaxID=1437191 RepID=UPI001EAF682C|nr:uncharacterized protein LOC114879887 [Osmia bicornis bicornis]